MVTALMLAGVRNVQPRPSVGFKFHAVLVVNSAHIASLGSPDRDRWLPIFWPRLLQTAQARDEREGNWTMEPVDEKPYQRRRSPPAVLRCDGTLGRTSGGRGCHGAARSASTQEVFESFFPLGCRDFRSIGHKAIYVANAKRTLECIGWQHAEPILRWLAYALLNHEGEPNPSQQDLEPDAVGRRR